MGSGVEDAAGAGASSFASVDAAGAGVSSFASVFTFFFFFSASPSVAAAGPGAAGWASCLKFSFQRVKAALALAWMSASACFRSPFTTWPTPIKGSRQGGRARMS